MKTVGILTILVLITIILIKIEKWRDEQELKKLDQKRQQEQKKHEEESAKIYETTQNINSGDNNADSDYMAQQLHKFANRRKAKE